MNRAELAVLLGDVAPHERQAATAHLVELGLLVRVEYTDRGSPGFRFDVTERGQRVAQEAIAAANEVA